MKLNVFDNFNRDVNTVFLANRFLVVENRLFRLLWGVCGALVESTPFVRRVMGSTPALAAA